MAQDSCASWCGLALDGVVDPARVPCRFGVGVQVMRARQSPAMRPPQGAALRTAAACAFAAQPVVSCAAQQAQQHGLGLVVAVVGERQQAVPGQERCEHRVPRGSRCGF
jgi:hypothetical protein